MDRPWNLGANALVKNNERLALANKGRLKFCCGYPGCGVQFKDPGDLLDHTETHLKGARHD